MSRYLILALLVAVSFAADHKVNLGSTKSLFIAGNNQAAEAARVELKKGKGCFTLAPKADVADAVLAIDANAEAIGDGLALFGQRSWIASGTLTLKSGDLVWSRSERFDDAPFTSGGKVAGKLLLKDLEKDSSCKKR